MSWLCICFVILFDLFFYCKTKLNFFFKLYMPISYSTLMSNGRYLQYMNSS